jgi:phenylacetate-CoA ligase
MYNLIAEKIFAPTLDLLRGTQTMKCLKSLERSQWLTRDEILEIQNKRLRKLVKHAFDTVPYYHRIMSERRIKPGDIECSDDLEKLPVLTRQCIRKNFDDLLSRDFNPKNVLPAATGGATGEPLLFYCTREDQYSWGYARWLRAYSWYGYRIGDKTILLRNPRPHELAREKWRHSLNQLLERRVTFDAAGMSEQQLTRILDKLNTFQPHFVTGYPSAVYLLARYIEKHGAPGLSVKKIITGGEQLYEHQRELIERIFQCECFSAYSAWEIHNIAAECEEHTGYHIAAENVIVEVVDDEDNPVPAGTEGRMLITNLHNYAMPFIRYDIGDVGVKSDEACPCGRGLPLLVSLNGRTTDIISTRSGKSISGLTLMGSSFMRLLASRGVEHIQIVQENLDGIIVKLAGDAGQMRGNRDELSAEIVRQYKDKIQDEIDITVQFVDEIVPGASGKRQFIISKLPSAH